MFFYCALNHKLAVSYQTKTNFDADLIRTSRTEIDKSCSLRLGPALITTQIAWKKSLQLLGEEGQSVTNRSRPAKTYKTDWPRLHLLFSNTAITLRAKVAGRWSERRSLSKSSSACVERFGKPLVTSPLQCACVLHVWEDPLGFDRLSNHPSLFLSSPWKRFLPDSGTNHATVTPLLFLVLVAGFVGD